MSESQDDSVDSIDNDAMKTEGWRPRPGEPSIEEEKIIFKKMLGENFDLGKEEKTIWKKMCGDNFDCNYDDDYGPDNPSDHDFDSIDSSDSCQSVNLGNQTWIHKKDDDYDKTVKSDNQL